MAWNIEVMECYEKKLSAGMVNGNVKLLFQSTEAIPNLTLV